MKANVFRAILSRVEQIEQTQSLENFVLNTTFGTDKHKMKVKEYSFASQLGEVYQDLTDLELADLVDEQKFVGEFDGKFS